MGINRNTADITRNAVAKSGDTMTGVLTSSVATGTAPFTVASTTAVTNLNADLLDGYNALDFAASSHTHDWTSATITNKGQCEGSSGQDANTSIYHTFLSNYNTPDGNYWYIIQTFWGTASTSSNRMQLAIDYYNTSPQRMYIRRNYSGSWSSWERVDNGEGLTRSIGSSGYAKLPGVGGLILQWGTFTRTGADMYVSFPMTFPNACYSVVVTDMYNSQVNDSSRVASVSTSSFYTRRADSTAFNVMYQAIGY